MKIDFQRAYQTVPCARGRMRCLAMIHLQKGKTVKEVSKIVQQSSASLHKWLRWLREESGIEHLTGFVKGRGRPSKLHFVSSEELISEIEKLQSGREGGRVTGTDIQDLIQIKWGISYGLSSIYQLLKRLNIVWVTSRSRHPKEDPVIQDTFKKTSFKKSKVSFQKM